MRPQLLRRFLNRIPLASPFLLHEREYACGMYCHIFCHDNNQELQLVKKIDTACKST
jgi:hypothetical protein